MSARPASPPKLAARRLLPRALLCLTLALAILATPWWQQALASHIDDAPAMAICSVGNAGGAPAHLTGGHCQLCCGSQPPYPQPASALLRAAVPGISYPLAPVAGVIRSASLAPGNARARAPPAA